jgi:hypothetical protein
MSSGATVCNWCTFPAGCGHWVQQERLDEVNALLVDWLTSL